MNTKRRGRVFALIRLDLRVLVMGALTVLLGALAVGDNPPALRVTPF